VAVLVPRRLVALAGRLAEDVATPQDDIVADRTGDPGWLASRAPLLPLDEAARTGLLAALSAAGLTAFGL